MMNINEHYGEALHQTKEFNKQHKKGEQNTKAAVVHPCGKIKYETVDDSTIKNSTDTVIKVISTSICRSDLHV